MGKADPEARMPDFYLTPYDPDEDEAPEGSEHDCPGHDDDR